MIVTCERCATQFQLDDSRIPATGVRVRCSRCKHAFQIQLPEPGGPAESAGDDEESDWEFNADLPGNQGDTTFDGIGRDAATDVVDELLGGTPQTPEPAPEPSPGDMFGEPSGLEIGEPEAASEQSPIASGGDDGPALDGGAPTAAQGVPIESHGAPSEDSLDLSDDGSESGLDLDSDPTPPRRRASDELESPESWDLLGDAEEAGDELDFGASTSRPVRPFDVDPNELIDDRPAWYGWAARAGAAVAWLVVAGLFLLGLYSGLKPELASAPPAIAVGDGLEVVDLGGRWIDHVDAGPIYVVSGRLHNGGGRTLSSPWLALQPLNDAGESLGPPAPIGSPHRAADLRELSLETLVLPGDAGHRRLRPGEKRAFEAVVGPLPSGARDLRVVPLQPTVVAEAAAPTPDATTATPDPAIDAAVAGGTGAPSARSLASPPAAPAP